MQGVYIYVCTHDYMYVHTEHTRVFIIKGTSYNRSFVKKQTDFLPFNFLFNNYYSPLLVVIYNIYIYIYEASYICV